MFIILDEGFFGDRSDFVAAFNTLAEADAFIADYNPRHAWEVYLYEVGTRF